MDSLARDLRLAFRRLLRSPGLSAVTVLALALGIGLTVMMFSIIYGAFWRGLPFEDAHRLIHLERSNLEAGLNSLEVPIHDFVDWRAEQRSFDDLAAFHTGTVNLAGDERAERFDGAFITPGAFGLLGIVPALGRTFTEEEARPSAEPVILLGWHVWQERYGGDPEIVGRTVRANGRPTTVVGVMPDGFRFPMLQDVWVPLQLDPVALPRGEGMTLEVFGRLRDEVSLDQAAADMDGIARRLALEYPATNEGIGPVLKPYTKEYVGDETPIATTMLGGVLFVLLIACANVASLLLARAAQRTRELGVRNAMGARRSRLVVQFLLEAFAVAAAGAVIGMGIAWLGVAWFNRAIAETGAPFWIVIRIDSMSVVFALAATLLATVASGGLPAWQAARADVATILKDESRGSSGFRIGRLTRGLVVLEVALSCALLVAAGLTIRSVIKLNTIDYAFATEDVLTARIGLMESDYPDSASLQRFYEDLEGRLNALPEVEAASLTTALPGFWGGWSTFGVEGEAYGQDRDRPSAHRIPVGPRFFETFGVTPLRGRTLTDTDRPGSIAVAVVNESFARRHLDGDAVGRRLRFGTDDDDRPWRIVVGVVPDMHAGGVRGEDPEAVYVPLAQADPRFLSIAARTRGDPYAGTAEVRAALSAVDTDIPLYWVGSLQDRIDAAHWDIGVFGSIFGLLGMAALFLAGIGLYAVMAHAVGRRTREIGIRMALGAHARQVLGMVLRQGIGQIALGLALGLGLAAMLARLLTDMLFDIDPRDPLTFAVTVLVLAGAGMTASLLPARRATRVDPVTALRAD